MWIAKVISKWVSPTSGRFELDAARFLRKGDSIMDITGQPVPVGAVVVCELWCNDPATIDAIMADKDYAKTVLDTKGDIGEQKTPAKVIEASAVPTKTDIDAVKATLTTFGADAKIVESVKETKCYGEIIDALLAEIKIKRVEKPVDDVGKDKK